LIGQLLVFRHAPPDRRPQLLAALGEAYYRCFRKVEDVDDPRETQICRWLEKICAQSGSAHTIELVHPGERFDSTRHLPLRSGGIEVAEVHGWVVLNDRDKVYMKAPVTTR
jgi:hypothetical protein